MPPPRHHVGRARPAGLGSPPARVPAAPWTAPLVAMSKCLQLLCRRVIVGSVPRTTQGEGPMADVTKTVKDAAYITVGLGVIAFQKAQVRRQELRKQFETQLEGTRTQVQKLTEDIQTRIEPVISQVEGRLPKEARDLVDQARSAAKDVQGQVLS